MPVNSSVQERADIQDNIFCRHCLRGKQLPNAQEIITHFSKSAKAFVLKINLKKTEIMYQPLQGSHGIDKDIQGWY